MGVDSSAVLSSKLAVRGVQNL
ncbi:hypothetical protein ACF1BQ_031100 [Bradyrhizobium sp. RDT10]